MVMKPQTSLAALQIDLLLGAICQGRYKLLLLFFDTIPNVLHLWNSCSTFKITICHRCHLLYMEGNMRNLNFSIDYILYATSNKSFHSFWFIYHINGVTEQNLNTLIHPYETIRNFSQAVTPAWNALRFFSS